MSKIITFLGKAGTEPTKLAIAAAKKFARQEKQVLLVTHTPGVSAQMLLGMPLTTVPQVIDSNLQAVQLQATAMLDEVWAELKKLLALYLPLPDSEKLYSGELIILPGFDSLLSFNALRKYYQSQDYDVIIYDGRGDLETLRMLGIPNILDWYLRRFDRIFEGLDLNKIADSIGGPIATAIVSANVDTQKLKQGLEQVRDWIAQGVSVVDDPKRLSSYLVTTDDPGAIAEAQWLWGSAQQVHLGVHGVFANLDRQPHDLTQLQQVFDPLTVYSIPSVKEIDWEAAIAALPDFNDIPSTPTPFKIDLATRQVIVFLPGFTKKQVKLTQYGPELTIEAGDQRQNILLPPELQSQSVKSGKFEEPYLLVSFE
jgi:anion-transporting  ArsA/GET3 family ATPase